MTTALLSIEDHKDDKNVTELSLSGIIMFIEMVQIQ